LKSFQSIAIINPLADYGINTYCFELAEGLTSAGVRVDLYTGGSTPLSELPTPQHHRCYRVLGSALFKQRRILGEADHNVPAEPEAGQLAIPPVNSNLKRRSVDENSLWGKLRNIFLELELVVYLKWKRYDLVWTQWPNVYGSSFWRTCRLLGLRTVHTVHNVLPHEESPGQAQFLRKIYRQTGALVVHSEASKKDLLRFFPKSQSKVVVARHGTYTLYPRNPEAGVTLRDKLNIARGRVACLLCGAIRPYKNIDAVLNALQDKRAAHIVLIVAGQESGYPNSSHTDPLARTRAMAQKIGVIDQVRLIPRFLNSTDLATLFEAADILVLPYLKNYGSGLLLLGMTFGKYILATDTGGAGEYLVNYPRHQLLEGPEASHVAEGLSKAVEALSNEDGQVACPEMPELQWHNIARNVLPMLMSKF